MVNKEEQSAAADSTQDKFKNGEQLAQAYANLEAEFTRRSQRMSELARENEELKRQLENGQATQEERWEKTLGEFWRQYPGAERFAQQIEDRLKDGERTEQSLREVCLAVLSEQAADADKLADSEEFMQTHVFNNPEICDRIVMRYLEHLNEGAPVLLFQKEGSLPSTPRRSAKTLEEAGSMTLGLWKK